MLEYTKIYHAPFNKLHISNDINNVTNTIILLLIQSIST